MQRNQLKLIHKEKLIDVILFSEIQSPEGLAVLNDKLDSISNVMKEKLDTLDSISNELSAIMKVINLSKSAVNKIADMEARISKQEEIILHQ